MSSDSLLNIIYKNIFTNIIFNIYMYKLDLALNKPSASLQRATPPQWVSWYDTKQSDGEAPVIL